ncbi:MAG: hypothetical protein GXX96_14870 [Planctomycetaceae bacterium]|mgnify:CR=1 FL=1|nr:hypothetical protein [Planctomycetaceae bacterium]
MRVLHYALVLAVALGAGTVTAQEPDKPKDKPTSQGQLPWWKLSDDAPAKDQLQAHEDPRVYFQRMRALQEARSNAKKDVAQPEKKPPLVRQVAKPEPRERLVYRLAHAPAVDIAQTVNELLRSEWAADRAAGNVVVLAEAVGNNLIISGTPDQIHETVKLVQELDAEPPMVCIQVVIGLIESREGLSLLAPNPEGPELTCSHAEACELIEQFSKSGAVKILARPQVMTLDNQPAFLQIGHRVPRVTGIKEGNVAATGLENVGLIVGITPRIAPDGVVTMEIDAEKSDLGPEHQGIPIGVDAKGNVVRSPKIDTMMVQTTVRIPPGQAVIIGGLALQDGDHRGELVIAVTPHIVEQEQ